MVNQEYLMEAAVVSVREYVRNLAQHEVAYH